jgi:hypothetical protein
MPVVKPSTKSIPEKLQIKPGRTVLFVNKPEAYNKLLGHLPDGVVVADQSSKSVDVVQLFVASKQQLEQELPKLKKVVAPKGMIWLTYPKLTSSKKTDINRDTIAAYAETLGLEGVAMVSIDDDWSALRLKVIS